MRESGFCSGAGDWGGGRRRIEGEWIWGMEEEEKGGGEDGRGDGGREDACTQDFPLVIPKPWPSLRLRSSAAEDAFPSLWGGVYQFPVLAG